MSAAEAIPAVTGKCRAMLLGACADVWILRALAVSRAAGDLWPESVEGQ